MRASAEIHTRPLFEREDVWRLIAFLAVTVGMVNVAGFIAAWWDDRLVEPLQYLFLGAKGWMWQGVVESLEIIVRWAGGWLLLMGGLALVFKWSWARSALFIFAVLALVHIGLRLVLDIEGLPAWYRPGTSVLTTTEYIYRAALSAAFPCLMLGLIAKPSITRLLAPRERRGFEVLPPRRD
jgi:hypothetical protein